MRKNFFSRVNIKENIYPHDDEAEDSRKECQHYEKMITESGVINIKYFATVLKKYSGVVLLCDRDVYSRAKFCADML